MTKKDYKAIAEVVRVVLKANEVGYYESDIPSAIRDLVSQLSTTLKNDNPRFKREVFWKACGL